MFRRGGMLCFLLTLCLGATAFAQGVTVDITPSQDAQDFANLVGYDIDELEQDIKMDIEKAYNVLDPKGYLRALADAAGLSNKGLGVDYASNMKSFTFGGGVNLSVSLGDSNLDELTETERPVGGLAPNISIMAGTNLGFVGLDRINLYGNYFQYNHSFDNGIGVFIRNFGFHGQFKLIKPKIDGKAALAFQWGGLDITSGLQYSRVVFSATEGIETEMDVGEQGMERPVLLTANGDFEVGLTGFTIPIEVSTNVRFLYILGLYGGIGTDIQFGSADIKAQVTGELTAEDPNNPNDRISLGTGTVDVTDSSGPNLGRFRFFGGIQANILQLKLFLQADVIHNKSVAVSMGARVAF